MSEKGSDELLHEVAPDFSPADAVLADWAFSEQEERNVEAAAPAVMEPGDDFPDADEIPPGDPPDYNPLPEGAP